MARKKDEREVPEAGGSEPSEPTRAKRRRRESPLERKEWDFNPLLGLESIKTTMSGLLQELFVKRESPELPWEPPVDLYERGEALVVEIPLPGVSRQDIHMHAYPNLLIVSGEARAPEGLAKEKYHFQERKWGAFHRAVPLPYVVAAEATRASLRDGVLRVTLPLQEKSPGKSVQIKID